MVVVIVLLVAGFYLLNLSKEVGVGSRECPVGSPDCIDTVNEDNGNLIKTGSPTEIEGPVLD